MAHLPPQFTEKDFNARIDEVHTAQQERNKGLQALHDLDMQAYEARTALGLDAKKPHDPLFVIDDYTTLSERAAIARTATLEAAEEILTFFGDNPTTEDRLYDSDDGIGEDTTTRWSLQKHGSMLLLLRHVDSDTFGWSSSKNKKTARAYVFTPDSNAVLASPIPYRSSGVTIQPQALQPEWWGTVQNETQGMYNALRRHQIMNQFDAVIEQNGKEHVYENNHGNTVVQRHTIHNGESIWTLQKGDRFSIAQHGSRGEKPLPYILMYENVLTGQLFSIEMPPDNLRPYFWGMCPQSVRNEYLDCFEMALALA